MGRTALSGDDAGERVGPWWVKILPPIYQRLISVALLKEVQSLQDDIYFCQIIDLVFADGLLRLYKCL